MASINIPDSVGKMGKHATGSIGERAFRGCDALKFLKLPDGCHCFPGTFEGMRGLEEVDIPASLEASQSAEVYGEPYKYYNFDLLDSNEQAFTFLCKNNLLGDGAYLYFKEN